MVQSTRSLSFDGTANQRMTVPHNASFDNPKTVSFWIKRTSNSLGAVFDETDNNASNGGFGIGINQSAVGDIHAYHEFSGTNGAVFTGAGALSIDVWHHVAITWDGTITHANWHIFVDGIDVTSGGSDGNGSSTAANDLFVGGGRSFYESTSPFIGLLDDLSIYSAVLSGANITGLAAGTTDPATLSPTGLWRFEEGSGTSVADTSGNGNTGTLSNGAAWSTDVPTQLGGAAPTPLTIRKFPHVFTRPRAFRPGVAR